MDQFPLLLIFAIGPDILSKCAIVSGRMLMLHLSPLNDAGEFHKPPIDTSPLDIDRLCALKKRELSKFRSLCTSISFSSCTP